MGREISDARGREETSVQLANINFSESEKFPLALSTPSEKSVRFGRLPISERRKNESKIVLRGMSKDLIDC